MIQTPCHTQLKYGRNYEHLPCRLPGCYYIILWGTERNISLAYVALFPQSYIMPHTYLFFNPPRLTLTYGEKSFGFGSTVLPCENSTITLADNEFVVELSAKLFFEDGFFSILNYGLVNLTIATSQGNVYGPFGFANNDPNIVLANSFQVIGGNVMIAFQGKQCQYGPYSYLKEITPKFDSC